MTIVVDKHGGTRLLARRTISASVEVAAVCQEIIPSISSRMRSSSGGAARSLGCSNAQHPVALALAPSDALQDSA